MRRVNQLRLPTGSVSALALLIAIFTVGCVRRSAPAFPGRTNPSHVLTGRVVRVADGDTVTLLDAANAQHRIRLQGIDAPESHQAFGEQSKKNLSSMIFGQQVTATCDKTDQYGREVCKIMFDDRTLIWSR